MLRGMHIGSRGVGSKLKVGAQFRLEAPEKKISAPPTFLLGPHFGAKILTVCVIADSGH